MRWKVFYRIKGDINIKSEIVDVHFEKKSDVKRWWLSKSITFVKCLKYCTTVGGYRQDKEFINCSKVEK
jgi:hypothetical protein